MRDIPKKNQQNITRERHRALKYRACQSIWAKWNSPADPDYPDYPEYPDYQVSSTAGRALPSTRAGGQDDVS